MRKSMKNILSRLSSSLRRVKGYTLIEMAITLTVVGGIIAIIAPSVNFYLKRQAVQTTLDNASLITGALNAYLIQHGAYPCPARMNAARTDPDYGFAGDCTDKSIPSPALPPLPAVGTGQLISAPYGGCGNGYCVQMSDRVWDTPPNYAAWAAANPQLAAELANNWDGRVRRGAVPFRDLGLQEYVAEDGYKNRFMYAVTENLAVKAKYDRNMGGIDIVNEQDISGKTAAQGNHQSNNLCGSGPNKVSPKEFCMGGGPINNTFYKRLVTAPADVPNTLTSVGGSVHYVVISYGPDRAGAYSHEGLPALPCPGTAGTLDAINCFVGPESSMPPAVYRAASYADAPGANHFDDTVKFYSSVEIPLWQVAGASGLDLADLANAGDDPARGKVGIDTAPATTGASLQVNSDVVAEQNILTNQFCKPGVYSSQCMLSSMTASCPGALISGFANGKVNCITNPPPSPCPNGSLLTSFDASGTHCTAPVSCTKTPVNMCMNSATGAPDVYYLPFGYQGDTQTLTDGDSYTKSFICNSTGHWKLTSTTGVCVCQPGAYTQTCYAYLGTGCSSCWSGVVNLYNNCPGGTSTLQSQNCACQNYTTPPQSVSCPAGYIGTQTTTTTYTCDPSNPAAPAVAGPPQTTGTCTCDPTATGTQSISCQAAGYGAGYSGTVTQTRSMNCTAGAWGPWTTTQNTCACSPIIQYQQIGCPAPQIGTQYQSQTYDCTANAWGPWTTYSNTCGAVVHTWEMASSPNKTTNNPAAIQVGESCQNVGQTKPCSASAGSGSYYQYPICQCQ